jgi:uncharacterized protein with PQ loop repeat
MSIEVAQIALDIAVCIYVFHLIPQLWRTASQNEIKDLSMTMVRLSWVGWVMDIIYAKLNNMPTQYFIVSYLGVLQIMIWISLLLRLRKVTVSEFVSLGMCLLIVLFSPLKWILKIKFLPILSIGQLCFWFCWVSQLIKSFIQKSAHDISLITLSFSIIGTTCSFTAAILLGWETQYIINLLISILFHATILAVLSYLRFQKSSC